MPELPEVEVTRQSFADRIKGGRIQSVRVGKPLRWPLPLMHSGHEQGGLLMHLGMSGSLAFGAGQSAPGPHDHFDLVTSEGTLRLTDPRRFGAVVWSPSIASGAAGKLLASLGLEPFDPAFTGKHLHTALRGRKVAIKQALLGGAIVVGAGNIYACEALFEARIDPRTRSDKLSLPRCEKLAEAVRTTLARALELGGSTLRNFQDAHGMAGQFQAMARVYGREGKPCAREDGTVRRIVQGQRATFFCPNCQRR
jgi:formamidopyrimidine-DNA glycosylase